MDWMNAEQFKSLVRMILQWFFMSSAGAAFLATIGMDFSENLVTIVAGLVAGVAGLFWSMAAHKTS